MPKPIAKATGVVTAVNETITGVDEDGEVSATYTVRVNIPIDRKTYLDLQRCRLREEPVEVTIGAPQQGDLFDGESTEGEESNGLPDVGGEVDSAEEAAERLTAGVGA